MTVGGKFSFQLIRRIHNWKLLSRSTKRRIGAGTTGFETSDMLRIHHGFEETNTNNFYEEAKQRLDTLASDQNKGRMVQQRRPKRTSKKSNRLQAQDIEL